MHVASWNVNGKRPSSENLTPWLSFSEKYPALVPDLVVVGFQEIVELNAQQIMATDSSKRVVWEELTLKTINAYYRDADFVILRSSQLVGAALMVFVRNRFASNIRNVQSAIKKTGLAGLAGNKGGVGIAFDFFDTSVCFVCAHLAAGHSNFEDRNNDFQVINNGLVFGRGKTLSDYDQIVWFGDFNYRIDLDNASVRTLIKHKHFAELMEHDQLKRQMAMQNTFVGFREAPIRFAPTYRYDAGTNDYDTSEKARVPAWTDRVLYAGSGITIADYDRAELMSSDHKPVKALFQMELTIINRTARDSIEQQLYHAMSPNSPHANHTLPVPATAVRPGSVSPRQQLTLPGIALSGSPHLAVKHAISEGMLVDVSERGTPSGARTPTLTEERGQLEAPPPALPPRPSEHRSQPLLFGSSNSKTSPVRNPFEDL